MSAERTLHVVELANAAMFTLGIVSQMLAVYTLLLAKRYRDAAKDWADSAKTWSNTARELEEASRQLLAENERRYGVRTTPPPAQQKEKPS